MPPNGWTLIELATVLAIVAILAAYAIPNFREQASRAYRGDAVAGLYRAALWVEQWSAEQNETGSAREARKGLPRAYAYAPPEGRRVYRLELRWLDQESVGSDYELRAIPLSDGPMAGDEDCGTFTLSAQGQFGNLTRRGGAAETDRVQRCWGRR